MTRNTDTTMVVHRGGRTTGTLVTQTARALLPQLTRYLLPKVASSVYNSLPSLESVGRGARRLKNGYTSEPAVGSSSMNNAPSMMHPSVTAPAAVSYRYQSRRAIITAGKHCTTVKHRELITSAIAGSTSWTIQSTYNLQPGDKTTFPWLSVMAPQYKEYQFRDITVEYVPIAPTNTQGDVILTPEYDSSSVPPLTEQQAVDHRDCVVDSCWRSIVMRFDRAALGGMAKRRYVRTFATAGDIKTFDAGKLYISTNNQTGTSTVGKLFISYTIDFFVPTLESAFPAPIASAFYTETATQTFATGVATVVPFTDRVNGLNILQGTQGVFTLPKGAYNVICSVSAFDSTAETFTALMQPAFAGAILAGGAGSVSSKITAPAGGGINLTSVATFVSDGASTFSMYLTLTGAGGTLTVPAYNANITFTLA